ncbi:MAG: MoxR family ATPase [Bacteroidetes bacterium]|nr:MAG: MoxR family ATPase [Bacteroidota bacterium]
MPEVSFNFDLPKVSALKAKERDPEKYLLSPELVSAVKVSLSLGQPLFLTGEPGTGKTLLAYKIAHHFRLANDEGKYQPFVFNTKTTSTAQDLFYTYDAVRHFRDANIRRTEGGPLPKTVDYIELQALGKAIALTNPEVLRDELIAKNMVGEARASVVLIDEIDKAPTDFPNDILYEIENMAFEIREIGKKIRAGDDFRPVVVMTSNSEKNLPDAFLRRCVFYHIPFPDKTQLIRIVQTHLGSDSPYTDERLIDHFLDVREAVKKKKPATAELIGWLRMLEMENFFSKDLNFRRLTNDEKRLLRFSYSVLAKNKDDLAILEQTFCR